MFSDMSKNLKKIFLFILLFSVGNTYTIFASDDQVQYTQSTSKKRPRPQEPEDELLSAGASLHTSSASISDPALEAPLSKAPKLEEDHPPSNAATTEGYLSAQPSTSSYSYLTAISLSQESSSSPGAILSAPQPQRSHVSSLVAAPSATTSIEAGEEQTEAGHAVQLFEESRVKTNKLAYFYKNEYFDFTEWETEVSEILWKVTPKIHRTVPSLNIALAQLSLIYEIGPKTHKVDFMLPYFFMSQFPTPENKKLISEALLSILSTKTTILAPEEQEKYNGYVAFHVGNGEGFEVLKYYLQFRTHLKNIFSSPESSLISGRIKELDLPVHKDFARFYLHSEQAILIYLMQKKR